MIEIAVIITLSLAVGKWLKKNAMVNNRWIPTCIVGFAIAANVVNAVLWGDLQTTQAWLDAGRDGFLHAIGAIAIHSGTKNTVEQKHSLD